MSYLGTTKIGKMFLGTVEIAKAYLANTLVYQSGGGPTPPPLPYDAEIAYLQCTGINQYIDTGQTIDFQNHDYDFSFVAEYTDVSGRQLMGDGQACFMGVNAGRFELRYNSYYGSISANTEHTWRKTFVSKISYEYIDGTQVGSVDRSGLTPQLSKIFLFTTYGGPTTLYSMAKLKSAKLYVDSVPVFDMIPVRVGSVGYMYDRVSGTLFGCASSGTFTLGPDI